MLSRYCDGCDASIGTALNRAGRAVSLRNFWVEPRTRDAQYEPTRTPVRIIKESIEVFCDELVRVGLEVAPLVGVHEPCRGDGGPTRNCTEPPSLRRIERPIDRDEFIVLELAHLATARVNDGHPL